MTKTIAGRPTTNDPGTSHLPIGYHYHVEREFEYWAGSTGFKPSELRHASEQAIRTRHHEATIEHESHKARGRQPNIYTLDLSGTVDIYYTIEAQGIVIRGYSWELDHEPRDDFEGGGFNGEYEWGLPS